MSLWAIPSGRHYESWVISINKTQPHHYLAGLFLFEIEMRSEDATDGPLSRDKILQQVALTGMDF